MKQSEKKSFDKEKLLQALDSFEVRQMSDGKVITTIDKKVVKEYSPKTTNYKVVDFKKVGKSFIEQIENNLDIKEMNISMNKRIQEIRLYGPDFTLLGETYNRTASLLNSTDGTRTLRLFAGIFRLICSNGMIVAPKGQEVLMKRLLHLKSNEDLSKVMKFKFGNFEKVFKETEEAIEVLSDRTTSLKEIREGMIQDNLRNATKFINFTNRLLNSKTDRLKGLTKQQLEILAPQSKCKSPQEFGKLLEIEIHNKFDMELNSYQAFQCYTETFKSDDSSIIQKETDRILELV